MKVHELDIGARLTPQKLSGHETPHVTIEPNTNCNIRCKFCYAIEHPVTKSLEDVKAEIDLAMEKRALDTISLLGGEPTLHPEIIDIVRYVKSKGLVCQLLTNGVKFLYHGDLELLDALVEAGVDRFLVHIDSGQAHVHGPDLDAVRSRMFDMLDAREVAYGLSLTLYAGEEHELAQIMKTHAHHRYFDGVLVTLAMDFSHAFIAEEKRRLEPDLKLLAHSLRDDLGIQPAAYLPTNLDDDEVAWLMYFYWINAETGETFWLSPEVNRAMKWLYRGTHDHEFFAETMDPKWVGAALAAGGAAELAVHPGRAAELARLLKHHRHQLRFHYIVVQQAPRMNTEHGKVQLCWQCPDAVIRNGRLTPVCMAGRLDPLGPGTPIAPRQVIEDVYHHLGEEPPPPRED